YRGMDIGTATPTADELAQAPHRLINIRDPAERYSVGEFCDDALREIEAVIANGNTPILVGGTMMYFHQLQIGYSELPSADANIRQQVADEAVKIGWPAMHAKLQDVDAESAQQLHPNDQQRVSRALEIFYRTGKSLSHWQREQHQTPPPYNFENIILAPEERSVIHERIEKRFDQMLAQGFLDEVEALYKRGDLTPELPSIRCVGYRQAWDYLAGVDDKETMREKSIIATRQLCKRQFTWLRRWQDARWVTSL
ncbi:MAG: tRNA (adenosine(37)-N6)-dimethylallyltransferase MiaA, partial [Coxiella sp. (in: Bacteria)]